MVEVECTTARPGGVALVAVRLDNRVAAPGVDAHRVRLAVRVDGPVWPPRVEGVPAGEWSCDGEGEPASVDACGSGRQSSSGDERVLSDGDDGSDVRDVDDVDEVPDVDDRGQLPDSDDGSDERALDDGDEVNASDDGRATVEVVVPVGRVGSVGFASPGEPAEPPVEVEAVEPAEDASDLVPSPGDVLRVLGDPSPPRDVVGRALPGSSSPDRPEGPG